MRCTAADSLLAGSPPLLAASPLALGLAISLALGLAASFALGAGLGVGAADTEVLADLARSVKFSALLAAKFDNARSAFTAMLVMPDSANRARQLSAQCAHPPDASEELSHTHTHTSATNGCAAHAAVCKCVSLSASLAYFAGVGGNVPEFMW